MILHWGPLHWFTGCWHQVPWEWKYPGHGLTHDQATTGYVNKCCLCGSTKPYYWGE